MAPSSGSTSLSDISSRIGPDLHLASSFPRTAEFALPRAAPLAGSGLAGGGRPAPGGAARHGRLWPAVSGARLLWWRSAQAWRAGAGVVRWSITGYGRTESHFC